MRLLSAGILLLDAGSSLFHSKVSEVQCSSVSQLFNDLFMISRRPSSHWQLRIWVECHWWLWHVNATCHPSDRA